MSKGESTVLDIVEKAAFLQTVSLFSKVEMEDLARIAAITQEVRWPKGHVIFREGDPADALYLVVGGAVGLQKGGIRHHQAVRGSSFGDLAVILHGPRLFTAVAEQDTRALSLSGADFLGLLEEQEQVAFSIIRFLAEWVARDVEDFRR